MTLQDSNALEFVSDIIGGEPEVISAATEAIKKDWRALRKAPRSLRRHKDVNKPAPLDKDWRLLCKLSKINAFLNVYMGRECPRGQGGNSQYWCTMQVVMAAVKQDWHAVQFADEDLWNEIWNREIFMEALNQSQRAMQCSPPAAPRHF